MRLIAAAFAAFLCWPITAVACDNPWPEAKSQIEAYGWRVGEISGQAKENFVYHFNHDLEPVTDFKPEVVYILTHKSKPMVKAVFVTDSCILAGADLTEETAIQYMEEPDKGI